MTGRTNGFGAFPVKNTRELKTSPFEKTRSIGSTFLVLKENQKLLTSSPAFCRTVGDRNRRRMSLIVC
jgi:hypothetical protein